MKKLLIVLMVLTVFIGSAFCVPAVFTEDFTLWGSINQPINDTPTNAISPTTGAVWTGISNDYSWSYVGASGEMQSIDVALVKCDRWDENYICTVLPTAVPNPATIELDMTSGSTHEKCYTWLLIRDARGIWYRSAITLGWDKDSASMYEPDGFRYPYAETLYLTTEAATAAGSTLVEQWEEVTVGGAQMDDPATSCVVISTNDTSITPDLSSITGIGWCYTNSKAFAYRGWGKIELIGETGADNPQANSPDPYDGKDVSLSETLNWVDGVPAPAAVRVFTDASGTMTDVSGVLAAGTLTYGPIAIDYDQVVQWQVRSYSDVGGTVLITDGDGYETWSITGPPAITGMTPDDGTIVDNRVTTLDWDDVPDANYYGVSIDGGAEIRANISEYETYVDIETPQTWSVSAYDEFDVQIGATSATLTITGPTLINSITPADGGQLGLRIDNLEWDAANDAVSFIVTYDGVAMPETTEPNVAVFADWDTAYAWSIEAFDSDSISMGTSATFTVVGPTLLPSVSPEVDDIVVGTLDIDLSWTANVEAIEFRVYGGTAAESGALPELAGSPLSGTELSMSVADWEADYLWMVECYADNGDPCSPGVIFLGDSGEIAFSTGPLAVIQDFETDSDLNIYAAGHETMRKDTLGFSWGAYVQDPVDSTGIIFLDNEGPSGIHVNPAATVDGSYVYSIFDPNLNEVGGEVTVTDPTSATFTMYNWGDGAKGGDDGRLIIRDAQGKWFLGDTERPLQSTIKEGEQDFEFPITGETWEEIVGPAAAHMNGGGGEPASILDGNLDSSSSTPDLYEITGGGVMIMNDQVNKSRGIAKVTWFGSEYAPTPNAWLPNLNGVTIEAGATTTLTWRVANSGNVTDQVLIVDGVRPGTSLGASAMTADVILSHDGSHTWMIETYADGALVPNASEWTIDTASCVSLYSSDWELAAGDPCLADVSGALHFYHDGDSTISYLYDTPADLDFQGALGMTFDATAIDVDAAISVTVNGSVAVTIDAGGSVTTSEPSKVYVDLSSVDASAVSSIEINVTGAGAGQVNLENIRLCVSECVAELGLLADLDGDCEVDTLELLVVATDWLRDPENDEPGIVAAGAVVNELGPGFYDVDLNVGWDEQAFDDKYGTGDWDEVYGQMSLVNDGGEEVLKITGTSRNSWSPIFKIDAPETLIPSRSEGTIVWKADTSVDSSGYRLNSVGYISGADQFVKMYAQITYAATAGLYDLNNDGTAETALSAGTNILLGTTELYTDVVICDASDGLTNDYCTVNMVLDSTVRTATWSVSQGGSVLASGTLNTAELGSVTIDTSESLPSSWTLGGIGVKPLQGAYVKSVEIKGNAALRADYDDNGIVDLVDFALVSGEWMKTALWP